MIYFYDTAYSSIVTVPEVRDEVIMNRGNSATSCQSFDGETVKTIASVSEYHTQGCMALYGGQPLIIGGSSSATVESLELRYNTRPIYIYFKVI